MRETRETRFQLRITVMAVITVVMMLLMMGMMTIVSHAEEGKVTASSVNIRESADTGSEMVYGAQQGDILPITGEVTGADGMKWYQVTYEGNKTGYVRSDLMEKVSGGGNTAAISNPSTPASGVQAVQPISAKVTREQVRVRSDASTSGRIVTTVQKDVVVTVTGSASDSEGKTWYQVSFSDSSGQVNGFIREDYLSLQGEVIPADQVPEEPEPPAVEDPAEPEEPEPEPEPEHKDYETRLEEDGWYLLDYTQGDGYKYSIQELFEVADKNRTLYDESQAKLKSTKTIMIILVVVVILLALAATMLFFKIRDMMDAAYFEEVEQETIRKRQGQRTAGRASMPTVGAGGKASSGSQSKSAGSSQQTRAGGSQTRPAGNGQARSAGNGQSRPAGNGQTRSAGNGQTRPAGNGQARPVGSGQAKPAGSGQQGKTAGGQARPVQQASKPAQAASKPAQQASRPAQQTSQNAARQSKNFMADDDEFEFEFLNWDGEEDN